MTRNSRSSREDKISRLIGLITGELSLDDVKAKRSILCIQWDDEDPESSENIYIIDSKRVDYKAYLKATS